MIKPYYEDDRARLDLGDCLEVLRNIPDQSVHAIVTSPPYWGLRSYEGLQERVWGGDPHCDHAWSPPLVSWDQRDAAYKNWANRADDGLPPPLAPHVPTSLGRSCSLCEAYQGALGAEPLHDCNDRAKPGEMVLRDDLTPEQVAFVMSELAKYGPPSGVPNGDKKSNRKQGKRDVRGN